MARLCEACGSAHYETEILPELESELELEEEGEEELEFEDELEGEGEFEFEDEGELEFEAEGEYEDEFESEEELSPIRKIYPDAMMEHLGELAAEAETEEEAAEHFLPLIGMAASKLLPVAAKALAPAAKRLMPKVVRAVTRVTPQLTRKVGQIARTLHRQPGARRLLKVVPQIARKTVHSVARQAAHGRTVTPRMAVRTLTRTTRHVLGHPARRAHAMRRHNHIEKRFHRTAGRTIGHGIVRPHWRYHRIGGRLVRVPHHVARHGVQHGIQQGVQQGAGRRVTHATGASVIPGTRVATRTGRIVAGQCICPACVGTGVVAGAAPAVAPAVAPAPAYCRCCGQVIR